MWIVTDVSSPRALCLAGDPALRRTLRRALQAVGSTCEFADGPAALDREGEPPDLVVLDSQARKDVDPARLAALHGGGTKVVVVGESIGEDEILQLLGQAPYNHLIAESTDPDADELVVTTVKLLRGDIFGLEKYLAWGVLVHERDISDYEDKRRVLLDVAEFARETGARRQLVARIESVTDELLMNALYDAPAVRYGVRPRIGERSRAGLGPLGGERVQLRFACDGQYFAVSVRDNYGELRKEAILANVARARAERGSPRFASTDSGGGAGLGLFFVISSVTRFIANVEPGKITEVICLFDLRATGRELEGWARSLHVFTVGGPAGHAVARAP